jgi:hypothetical protein
LKRPYNDSYWHNHESPIPGVNPMELKADLDWLKRAATERR